MNQVLLFIYVPSSSIAQLNASLLVLFHDKNVCFSTIDTHTIVN